LSFRFLFWGFFGFGCWAIKVLGLSGFGFWSLGYRGLGFGFRVLGFRVKFQDVVVIYSGGLEFEVCGLGCRGKG